MATDDSQVAQRAGHFICCSTNLWSTFVFGEVCVNWKRVEKKGRGGGLLLGKEITPPDLFFESDRDWGKDVPCV